jgi:hypothetical protein
MFVRGGMVLLGLAANVGLARLELDGVGGKGDEFAAAEVALDGAIAEAIEGEIESVAARRDVYTEGSVGGDDSNIGAIERHARAGTGTVNFDFGQSGMKFGCVMELCDFRHVGRHGEN